jgi:hypothetical protein
VKIQKPSKTAYDDHRKASADRHYATVLTVDPVRHTATVLTSDNRVLRDIPIIKDTGGHGAGDFSTPEPGWQCVLTQAIGVEAIDFCFPAATYFSDGQPPEHDENTQAVNTFLSLTGAPAPYRKVENPTKSFRGRRPYDLIAGDQGFRTSEGASVFALRGGVAGIKVDDLCQILLNQVDHLTRVVSRQFELMTDAGIIQSENDKGKTSFRVRANSAARNTYSDAYEFDLKVGANASKAFIDYELRSPDTRERSASLKMDQTGTSVAYQRGDDLREVGGRQGLGVAGNQKIIVAGNQDIEVDGNHRLKCGNVNLGDNGGEKAPMGEQLQRYLDELKFFLDTQLMVMTSMGPSTPGAFMKPSPTVPRLLSDVVKYIQR